MGEVYRATDTNLGRQVAIKVLPETVAADPERLARFDREARTLAALNHPHIAQIYGLEKSDGVTALVMELVEGPTLADVIESGVRREAWGVGPGDASESGTPHAPSPKPQAGHPKGLPLSDALAIATQILEALEAAHEQGIIHRDLKPANVKVRDDGTVKVLDFGLAKAMDPGGVSGVASASMSPTITTPAQTMQGTILGTAAYMAPEQAKGRAVDQRADIWAFGAVLFEMLSGRRAFDGEDVTDVLGAVVRLDPPWDALPADLPARVERVIRACLQKNVKARLANVQDVRLELEGAFDIPGSTAVQAVSVPPPVALWRHPAVVGGALLLAAVVVGGRLLFGGPEPAPDAEPIRFSQLLPEGQNFRNTGRRAVAVSPDGRHFAYNATGGLYVRDMAGEDVRVIAGTEDALTSPTFSPDGEFLAYVQLQQLKKISIAAAGAPVPLAELSSAPYGISWGADDTVVWDQADGIWQMSGQGGDPVRIVEAADNERLAHPQILPGGRWVLMTVVGQTDSQIVVQSLDSGTRQTVVSNATEARYIDATRQVLYLGTEGGLFAVAFDPDRPEATGGPRSVLPFLATAAATGAGQYAVSRDGTLVYVASNDVSVPARLVWVDRGGRKLTDTGVSGLNLAHPALSPDDTFVAFTVSRGDNLDVVRYNLLTTTENPVGTSSANDARPVWSPSGEWILFQTSDPNPHLFMRRADGVGDVQAVPTADYAGSTWTGDWGTQNGKEYLLLDLPSGVRATGTVGAGGVWYQSRSEGDTDWDPPVQFQPAPAMVPQFSPNGRYVAYGLNAADPADIRIEVAPFPAADHQWPISAPGGSRLRWSPTGSEIFWVQGEDLMHVRVSEDGPSLDPGPPERLFTWPGLRAGQWDSASFDISRDGERFLVIETQADVVESRPILHVVQNWFTELKRVAPTE